MAFVQWTKKHHGRGTPRHPIANLEVDQCYVSEGTNKGDWYAKVYYYQKKYGYRYAYQTCVNGIVIKRIE